MGIGLVEDVLDSLVNCKRSVSTILISRGGCDSLTGVDAVGVLVGDLDAELLLDGHDDLNGVETVQAEVVGEVGSGLDLLKDRVRNVIR